MIKINEMCKELKRIYQEMNKDIEEMSKIVNKRMNECLRPEFDSLHEYMKDKGVWF